MNLLALSELKCRVTVWGAANLLKNLLNESCTITPTYHLFFLFSFFFLQKKLRAKVVLLKSTQPEVLLKAC